MQGIGKNNISVGDFSTIVIISNFKWRVYYEIIL